MYKIIFILFLIHPSFSNEIYLTDPNKLVRPEFSITKLMDPYVRFWFRIYTMYNSSTFVIHSRENLDLVYDVQDYSSLLNPLTEFPIKKSLMQKSLLNNKIKDISGTINNIKNNKSGVLESKYLSLLSSSNKNPPIDNNERDKFFKDLISDIRVQAGQQNFIHQGLENFNYYRFAFSNLFTLFDVPQEFLAIPLLESSFNFKAESKANAVGIWQFMNFVGKQFLPISKNIDGRVSPAISTLAALHLHRLNYRILQNWSLAVIAYNSGHKHILIAKDVLKNVNMTVEDFIINYKHPHIGFASKNFYAEFLALVYTIQYSDKIFPDLGQKRPLKPLSFYLSKNSFSSKSVPNEFGINAHLLNSKMLYPKNTIVASFKPLDSSKFKKIPETCLIKYYPRNLKLDKIQSCSTK